MLRKATIALFMLALAAPVAVVRAQDPVPVTIRQLNEIPQDNIDALNDAGTGVTADQINELIFGDLVDNQTLVSFRAVILSNPLNSGLSTPNSTTGLPSRVHIFVRDTAAASQGKAGMDIQIVTEDYAEFGLLQLGVGDVIDVTGVAAPFGATMQFNPSSLQLVEDYDVPAGLLDPVEHTETSYFNEPVASSDGQILINWDVLGDVNGQYVTIPRATVRDVTDSGNGRFTWYITTDDGQSFMNFYDTSLRYRNDRANYADEFNERTNDDFTPPVPGSVVSVTGFASLVGSAGSDPANRGIPQGYLLSIIPFEDSDVQVLESPPTIANLSSPTSVPGADPVTVTADVTADEGRTLSSVVLKYYTSSSTDTVDVTGTNAGAEYTFSIPAAADGDFVTYFVEATDSEGAVSESDDVSYRVLTSGIDDIADIQLTANEDVGSGPFTGVTTEMDITATVQTDVAESGFLSIQDGAGPWSGIFVELTEEIEALNLQPGDQVRITNATIQEVRGDLNFNSLNQGTTALTDVTLERTGAGTAIAPVVITTDALTGAVAEAHEGMLLQFNDVVITDNNTASGTSNFGEFQFETEGTTNARLIADDVSADIGSTYNVETFEEGDQVDFVRGVVSFGFGNFRILPRDSSDIGTITRTDLAEEPFVSGRAALKQSYPNPARSGAVVEFNVGRAGQVTLELFDVLGRRVATLVDGQLPAGAQRTAVDTSALPSGVYLYRLTAGDQVLTRRMTVVR